MPKVYNKRDKNVPNDAVYVGRPTKWGNPYVIGKDGTRDEVVTKYREYIENNPELRDSAKTLLHKKDLVCWCAPLKCHADVLLEIASGGSNER